METWQIALVIYLAVLGVTLLFAATTAGLLYLVGGRATAIDLGTPRLVPIRRADPSIRWGPVPLGTVQMQGAGEPAEREPGEHDWRRLGLARQLLVIVGPHLVTAAIAVALLGPAQAGRSFGSAIDQLVLTLDPTPLVRRFFALVATAPLSTSIGILLAKLTVINLLPFGSLAGGQVVNLLAGGGRREPPRAVQVWLLATTVFVMLYFGGRFAYAFVRAIVG